MRAGDLFAIIIGVPWLLPQQSGAFAQGFNQSISAVSVPIARMVLGMRCIATLAWFVGSYQRRKLMDTRTAPEGLATSGWR
ncbi:hypothetical protein [Xanthomonas arboricola]|uniref:hypothetical protein n=1 Tax=Xanthomonas arboricola TaxID=56448 RepID=UPI001C84ED93|nr:hypothetical protein [Xanthomonas arboricola]